MHFNFLEDCARISQGGLVKYTGLSPQWWLESLRSISCCHCCSLICVVLVHSFQYSFVSTMRHALVLASFGASALAQGYGWGGAYSNTSCVSVVTETVYNYTTVCPCSTTSLTVLPTGGSSGVVTTTPGNGGNTVNPTGATTLTSSTVPNPSSTTATGGASSSTTSGASTTLANPPSTTFTSTNVGNPTLTSFSSQPNPTSTIATTSVTNDPSPVVPGAGTTSTIALASLPSDYEYRALYAHNLHRNNASIPILAWSDELAGYALQLAQTCVYGHSKYVEL